MNHKFVFVNKLTMKPKTLLKIVQKQKNLVSSLITYLCLAKKQAQSALNINFRQNHCTTRSLFLYYIPILPILLFFLLYYIILVVCNLLLMFLTEDHIGSRQPLPDIVAPVVAQYMDIKMTTCSHHVLMDKSQCHTYAATISKETLCVTNTILLYTMSSLCTI